MKNLTSFIAEAIAQYFTYEDGVLVLKPDTPELICDIIHELPGSLKQKQIKLDIIGYNGFNEEEDVEQYEFYIDFEDAVDYFVGNSEISSAIKSDESRFLPIVLDEYQKEKSSKLVDFFNVLQMIVKDLNEEEFYEIVPKGTILSLFNESFYFERLRFNDNLGTNTLILKGLNREGYWYEKEFTTGSHFRFGGTFKVNTYNYSVKVLQFSLKRCVLLNEEIIAENINFYEINNYVSQAFDTYLTYGSYSYVYKQGIQSYDAEHRMHFPYVHTISRNDDSSIITVIVIYKEGEKPHKEVTVETYTVNGERYIGEIIILEDKQEKSYMYKIKRHNFEEVSTKNRLARIWIIAEKTSTDPDMVEKIYKVKL